MNLEAQKLKLTTEQQGAEIQRAALLELERERDQLKQEREALELQKMQQDDELAAIVEGKRHLQLQIDKVQKMEQQVAKQEVLAAKAEEAWRQRTKEQLDTTVVDRATFREQSLMLKAMVTTEAAQYKEVVRLWESKLEDELQLMRAQFAKAGQLMEREAGVQRKYQQLEADRLILAGQQEALALQHTALDQGHRTWRQTNHESGGGD